ncbi:MAG TPA: FliA/WhiG family RNA polymerase sigma factor [Acidisarcina sp.]
MMGAETAYGLAAGEASGLAGLEERNRQVEQELTQVYYIAARIRERLPQHVEMEDLVNAGVIGLLEAWRNFDATKNAQFKTFAKFRIRGAILDSLRELDWGSRAVRKQGREIAAAQGKLEGELGRSPLEEETARELKIPVEELRETVRELDGLYLVGQQVTSAHDGAETHDLVESAPSRGGDDPFELCLEGERKAHLAEAVARLPEREQLILSLYYREELTMKEIGKVVGLAVSRVSQIHSAAMATLRSALKELE